MWRAKEMSPSNGSRGWPKPPDKDQSRKRTLPRQPLPRKPAAGLGKHHRINRTSTTGRVYQVVPILSLWSKASSVFELVCLERSKLSRPLACLTQRPSCKISTTRERDTKRHGRESN